MLLNDILKELRLDRFIAFDFETTGLSSKTDDVIEFSATLFENGKLVDNLSFLCNPGVDISPEIQKLTGITNEMVKGKKHFNERLQEVMDYFGTAPLVGHNVGFDLGFLRSALKNNKGVKPRTVRKNRIYDTMLLAQAFYFYLPNHKLTTIAEYCGLSAEGAHRAGADTANTGKIFVKLVESASGYDLETVQTIKRILEGTDDPNYWLYQDLSDFLIKHKTLKSVKNAAIDWQPPVNYYGEWSNDEPEINALGSCADYFSATGKIAGELENFEPRPQQAEMADIVYDSLKNNKFCLVEAGTGVGKSLAYVVPSVLYLNENREEDINRLCIATNTKNLQEQIFFKEIPFIYHQLKLPFRSVLLKGRQNYICLTRWHWVLNDILNRVHITKRSALIPIVIWLKHTKTGDISENAGFKRKFNQAIWKEICSESGFCTTNMCKKHNGCFLGKIRRLAFTADIMVVNHSLLLADSAAENNILPPYQHLIVDEAHNLENNAYNYFAMRIGWFKIKYLMDHLASDTTPSRGLITDTVNICRQIKKLKEIASSSDTLIDLVEMVREEAKQLFSELASYKAIQIGNKALHQGEKKRYKSFHNDFKGFSKRTEKLISYIIQLKKQSRLFLEIAENLTSDVPEVFTDLKLDLKSQFGQLDEILYAMQIMFTGDDDSQIFWYELDNRGNNLNIEFAVTPLDIADHLKKYTYENLDSMVLTSATMRMGTTFDYISNRLGMKKLEEIELVTKSVGSPFSYQDQMKMYTFHRENHQQLTYGTVSRLIFRMASEINRNILVLFTSFSALKDIYNRLITNTKENRIKLLAQGYGGSRTAILKEFQQSRNAILLGTVSFWEGVDIIGDGLEVLVITKLPFAVPSEPIIEANMEKITQENGNAFIGYYVPDAVLKLRQGVGRLIRSTSDSGVVVNLDNRIDIKRYGSIFKASMPVDPETVIGEDNLIAQMKIFFKTK